jgi:hypothetical protein
MSTVTQLIDDAFEIAVGNQNPSHAQRTKALRVLNRMLDAMSIDRTKIYVVARESQTLTVGTSEYTIGTSGDWNTTRPIQIEDAYIRDSDNYDHPVLVMSRKEYNDVPSKTSEVRPTRVYYYPDYSSSLGQIWFDWEPESAETFLFDSWRPFTAFTGLGQTVTWPPGYEEAFVYNLARRLAPAYGRDLSIDDLKIARDALKNLANLNMMNIDVAEFDDILLRQPIR